MFSNYHGKSPRQPTIMQHDWWTGYGYRTRNPVGLFELCRLQYYRFQPSKYSIWWFNRRQKLQLMIMNKKKRKFRTIVENFLSESISTAQDNEFIVNITRTECLATPTTRYQKPSNFCPTSIFEFRFQIVIIRFFKPINYQLWYKNVFL